MTTTMRPSTGFFLFCCLGAGAVEGSLISLRNCQSDAPTGTLIVGFRRSCDRGCAVSAMARSGVPADAYDHWSSSNIITLRQYSQANLASLRGDESIGYIECDGAVGVNVGNPREGGFLGTVRANANCGPGEFLDAQGICRLKVCSCTNGFAAIGEDCPAHEDPKCVSCNSGYYMQLSSILCKGSCELDYCWIKVCQCQNGSGYLGADCDFNGFFKCETCDDGYHLNPANLIECIEDEDPDPGGHNDPHLWTWKGKIYDYHGQCDLIFTTCPSYGNYKGLHVHIRTQFVMPQEWSTITNLAVKLGADTFELLDDGTYYVNGEVNPTLSDTTKLAGHGLKQVTRATGPTGSDFEIILGHGVRLKVSNYIKKHRNSIAFKFTGVHDHRDSGGTSLSDCVGLTSTWDHTEHGGFLVGRGGTAYTRADKNIFGAEWQVDRTKGDPMLFAEDIGQQLPEKKCIESRFDVQDQRHLKALYTAEGGALARRAEEACRHLNGGNMDLFEACVFDVLVTGDASFAEEPWYNNEF